MSLVFLKKYFLLLWVMAKREGLLGLGGASTIGVVVPGDEVVARGEAKVVVMGVGAEARRGEPLLPLHPWYCSTSLFLAIKAPEFSSLVVSKKWILKGEGSWSYHYYWGCYY